VTVRLSRRKVMAAVLRGMAGVVLAAVTARDASHLGESGWLSTRGARLVDGQGRSVRLLGLNWAGAETAAMVPGGLHRRTIAEIALALRSLGCNVVRIPFSVEMMLVSPGAIQARRVAREPALAALSPRAALHAVVDGLARAGLMVILDNHRSDAGWGPQSSGLWYTPQYPATVWRQMWLELAREYRHTPAVIGFDLRNEPGSPPVDSDVAVDSGALWGYGEWSETGGASRDWAAEAEFTGNLIHSINSDVLIVVEGVRYDPAGPIVDDHVCLYWAGGNLSGVLRGAGQRSRARRIRLRTPNKLVYSIHDYPPSQQREPWNDSPERTWDQTWGDIARQGLAPVFIGETGGPHDLPRGGDDHVYLSRLTQYVLRHDLHIAFWDLNGTYPPGSGIVEDAVEPYGWLSADWREPLAGPLRELFRSLAPDARGHAS
jgi:aryl-phospho-beta-D-glucosidase BglC (GH1 family)